MFGRFGDYKMDLKRLIAAGALLLTSLIPKSASSYAVKSADGTDSIHPMLSAKLHQFLISNSLLPEGINFILGEVKQGSIDEDSPEYDYTRSYNHFCSWTDSNDGIWNFSSSKDWAMSSYLQSGKIPFNLFPWPLSTYYRSLYPEDNPNYPYGDNSWPRVIEQYQSGEVGTAFGHIFHLVSDATVPAHARLDAHWGEAPFLETLLEDYYSEGAALWPTDVYEVWTDEHKFEIINQLNPQVKNVLEFSSLPELFKDLAYFTGSNFYSDGSVDGTVAGLTEVMEGNKKYFVKSIEGKKVHVLRDGFLTDFPDTVCLEDTWKVLGTKSLEYGTAALNLLAAEEQQPPVECTNECAYGQTTCQDKTVMTCTNNDMDDCLEWAPAMYCGGGQVCKDGDCVEEGTTCFDECNYSGEKGCSGGDAAQCTNNDDDDCLEWAIAEYCAGSCKGGECVTGLPTCEDECDTYNQTSCSGNKVMKCDYNNSTGCLELVLQESCGGGEKCENGGCKPIGPTCQNECDYQGQASACVDNGFEGKFYTCSLDSKECLSWGIVTYCTIGTKCIDNECVLNECSKCSVSDETKCNPEGDEVFICEPNDNQSCLIWTSWYTCLNDEICINGKCEQK